MSISARKALVVGGGFSGMTAALELARRGVEVDLAEIDSSWRSYGAGISMNGAMLRVLRRLGLLEAFLRAGFASDGVEIRAPDDSVVAALPTPRIAGPDVPGGAGIMRPALAKILADAVRAAGVNIRLGKTFTEIEDRDGRVRVTFTDATASEYDVVVGADGLYSAMRKRLFPDAPAPKFANQAVWRAVLPRPAGINTVAMWMGPKLKVGLNGVSASEAYLFLTEDKATNDHVPAETHVEALKALLGKFGSPTVRRIGEELSVANQIVYRPLEHMLLPRPWRKGRIVLIGDAVHATTPHLAAGACIGMEDAVVLAEELERNPQVEAALDAFEERRFERCRMVVENSARLAEIEITGGDRQEHARIMGQSMMALAQEI